MENNKILFRQLFEPKTSTYTYIIGDKDTKEAVIIDPVKEMADRDLTLLQELGLKLTHICDTHIHADHITGASALKAKTGAKIIAPKTDDISCADRQVWDNDTIDYQNFSLEVISTIGHTDAHVAYYIPQLKAVFTGDALLIRGCGRTDFQSGSSKQLYHSITQKLFKLDEEIFVYPAHDYHGRTVSTIKEEKEFNPRLARKSLEEFVGIMSNLNLDDPKYMDVAIPANLKCGED